MASFQSLKKFSVPKRDNTLQLMHAVDQRRRARMAARRAAPARFTQPARAGETKGMDTDISTGSIVSTTNTNANISVLNLVQQGAGAWNRVGRKIHAKSVRIKGFINFSSAPVVATGIISQCSFRMILVWDKQPSDLRSPPSTPSLASLLKTGQSCPDITCPSATTIWTVSESSKTGSSPLLASRWPQQARLLTPFKRSASMNIRSFPCSNRFILGRANQ